MAWRTISVEEKEKQLEELTQKEKELTLEIEQLQKWIKRSEEVLDAISSRKYEEMLKAHAEVEAAIQTNTLDNLRRG